MATAPSRSSSTISHLTVTTPIPSAISIEDVLSVLHSPPRLIPLSPLVTSYKLIERAPSTASTQQAGLDSDGVSTYSVTERIDYLPFGLWPGHVTFTARFVNLEDGLRSYAAVPGSFEGEFRWWIGEQDAAGIVLKEDVRLECSIFTLPLVRYFARKAQTSIQRRLVEELLKDKIGKG
ncbi:MAG: hypothetical protein M1825_003482 [Sarcosagium campestre]|nr:MAG: hypothetical protein M1825_003482 [Sarcosagium campestre]